eukprot:CAMPEP_0203879268 /NCGR_PEP_ID=MMETSP0359-20131031/23753_1 /ASSEMBLY_ACC=CAM_ASM_000338 /TAXON_ID=268821 /ORGANISM="Scrippsiella Hangoei, Strain SHTV-5" /LENGTH=140 /DNA_ID=CAMNT_0050798653 /DNA_START=211 /DNA_END=634 /DNA_ORIENTATION=+
MTATVAAGHLSHKGAPGSELTTNKSNIPAGHLQNGEAVDESDAFSALWHHITREMLNPTLGQEAFGEAQSSRVGSAGADNFWFQVWCARGVSTNTCFRRRTSFTDWRFHAAFVLEPRRFHLACAELPTLLTTESRPERQP